MVVIFGGKWWGYEGLASRVYKANDLDTRNLD